MYIYICIHICLHTRTHTHTTYTHKLVQFVFYEWGPSWRHFAWHTPRSKASLEALVPSRSHVHDLQYGQTLNPKPGLLKARRMYPLSLKCKREPKRKGLVAHFASLDLLILPSVRCVVIVCHAPQLRSKFLGPYPQGPKDIRIRCLG